MAVIKKEDITFEKALKLFLEDCEIRNLRAHTIKYNRNELSAFYKLLKEQRIDHAPYKVKDEHIKNNPVKNIKLMKDRKQAAIPFSKDQLADLFKQPDLRTFTGIGITLSCHCYWKKE